MSTDSLIAFYLLSSSTVFNINEMLHVVVSLIILLVVFMFSLSRSLVFSFFLLRLFFIRASHNYALVRSRTQKKERHKLGLYLNALLCRSQFLLWKLLYCRIMPHLFHLKLWLRLVTKFLYRMKPTQVLTKSAKKKQSESKARH